MLSIAIQKPLHKNPTIAFFVLLPVVHVMSNHDRIRPYWVLSAAEERYCSQKEKIRLDTIQSCLCNMFVPDLAGAIFDYLPLATWKEYFLMVCQTDLKLIVCDQKTYWQENYAKDDMYTPLSLESLQQRILFHHQHRVSQTKEQDAQIKPLLVTWDSVAPCTLVIEPSVGHLFDIQDISDASQLDFPPSRVGFHVNLWKYLKRIVKNKLLQYVG